MATITLQRVIITLFRAALDISAKTSLRRHAVPRQAKLQHNCPVFQPKMDYFRAHATGRSHLSSRIPVIYLTVPDRAVDSRKKFACLNQDGALWAA